MQIEPEEWEITLIKRIDNTALDIYSKAAAEAKAKQA